MKKLKKIYGWIIASVLLQTAILAYFNYVYIPNRGAFRATMFEVDTSAVKNRSYKLPDGAEDIKVSFDGLYVAYRTSSGLEIADIDKHKSIKKLSADGGEFSYYRWLPDREMLIYSVKEPDGKNGAIRLSTYDIGPELDRSYPDIKGLPQGSSITDIELSPLTNIVYPMVKTSDTRARIYQFDIMDTLRLMMKTDLSTVIKETMYANNLIYQVPGDAIRIRNGKTGRTTGLPVKEADLLLAVDDNDYIYAGSEDKNGKLSAVYYGKAEQDASEWKKLTANHPVPSENIAVTAGGDIFFIDTAVKTITDLKGSGVTGYKGDFLTVLDNYIASVDGGKLTLKVLNK
ncbi:MAG TPA: hypothetical protein VHT96_10465 [Clostridia bacterium]|nr:hypothetical protein [Clostridia bacterium]